ncbi:hypothetical protein A21D_01654 [Virgibacillus dokdonensis]|uniref:Uncharacterized protein n=1 Tax=Virgibacillus dokdonensis TaxID=302167 RepID=A0A2K9IZ54_9BACI|nr:hypothetical protein A21D_01654 [Virgibacillus dokdonensis]
MHAGKIYVAPMKGAWIEIKQATFQITTEPNNINVRLSLVLSTIKSG